MTQTTPSHSQAVELARRFHDAYERLAPQFGYITREDTRAFDPESSNGKLMTAVCAAITSQQELAAPVSESVPEAVITGVLYGFASWLTCQPETISVGSRETAYQIIDALKAFADHHKLSLDSPDVENWRQRIAASRVPVASLAEPANYDKQEIDLLVHRITGQDTAENSVDALQNAARILDGKTIRDVVDELHDATQGNLAVADSGRVQGVEPVALSVKWPNGYVDLMWADEFNPDYNEQRGGEPTITELIPRTVPGGPVAQGEAVIRFNGDRASASAIATWANSFPDLAEGEPNASYITTDGVDAVDDLLLAVDDENEPVRVGDYVTRENGEFKILRATPANMAVGAVGGVGAEIGIKRWRKDIENGPVAVFYTDLINGEMVHRDDIWLSKTSQLATPAVEQATTGSGQDSGSVHLGSGECGEVQGAKS